MHGLMAHGRKVDDRQSTVAECDSNIRINPHAFIFRATMTQAGRHTSSGQRELFGGLTAGCIEEAGDAAHGFSPSTTRLRSELLLRSMQNSGAIAVTPGKEHIRFCRRDARP